METVSWRTDRIAQILPQEFFKLVNRNREHIRKTFPVTAFANSDLEKTEQFLTQALETEQKKEGYYFYLRSPLTTKLIGYVVIKNISVRTSKCELAYFIDMDYEGKGITTKAVANAVDFCFTEIGMNKVFICTSPVNRGSQRVAEKNGFVKEGILRQEFRNGYGEFEDIIYYGLLKSEHYNTNER
ncbi:GNAT family N-acetyltransferase [Flavobacterium sp.]|uniref:GNAT family N-acetyltransferase n=1 Tax=Flavobacterium sp. TaxID=239 RepID=UPI003A9490A1